MLLDVCFALGVPKGRPGSPGLGTPGVPTLCCWQPEAQAWGEWGACCWVLRIAMLLRGHNSFQDYSPENQKGYASHLDAGHWRLPLQQNLLLRTSLSCSSLPPEPPTGTPTPPTPTPTPPPSPSPPIHHRGQPHPRCTAP